MSITKNYNGSITLSELNGSYLITRTYYYYTLKEAKQMFKEYLTTL